MKLLDRLRRAGGRLLERETAVLTNAIAFNFLLCLFPLVLVLVAVTRQLPGGQGAGVGLLLVLRELIPFGHTVMAESLKGIGRMARGLEVASLFVIVWGSSGIFIPVEMALNRAWGGRGSRHFLLSRVLAFVMTLAGGLLVLVSVALTAAAREYGRTWPVAASAGAKVSAVLLSYLLFFGIYRFVPEVGVGTRTALQAALWGGTAWEIVKQIFVWRLPALNIEAVYGPLAFAVSLVLWAYLSSLVLVFGALMAPIERRRTRR